jgi:polysaccharide chain length determinant protein (PEP-CTERM system associated)
MLPGKKYTVFEYARMAWRRRWVIVVPGVLGAYAALIVSSQLRDTFQSEMLIQVVPQRVPDSYVRSTVTMRTQDRLNALSQQVMSRTELERLIREMNLYEADRDVLPMQDVVERMRANVSIQVMNARDADAFYVRFTYPDPAVATRVTERLGGLFIDMNARDRGDLAQATNAFLEVQLAEARTRLEEQERKLQLFRQRNAGQLPSQLDSNMQAINRTQLEVQALVESLARDQDRKLMLERLYNEIQAEVLIPAQPPVTAGALQQGDPAAVAMAMNVEQQLALARETLARLEIRLRPEHPDVLRTKGMIDELEKRLAEEREKQAAAEKSDQAGEDTPALRPVAATADQVRRERLRQMRVDIENLERDMGYKQSREQRLRTTIAEYQQRIEQVPGLESEWIALTRDYDTQLGMYKSLLAKSEESRVATELERRQVGEQFRILDRPRTPIRPIGIDRFRLNVVGAFGGLVVGLALAALLEFRDATYRTADDVLEVLELPVLALIPLVTTDLDRQHARRRRLVLSVVVALALIAGGYGIWTMELWRHIT